MNEWDNGLTSAETRNRGRRRAKRSTPAESPKRPRRLSRKAGVAIGVVAVVVVAAGAGLWVWHEQPSFCSAVCHSPMDSYVEGYYEADTLMSDRHLEAGVGCLSCHEPRIDQQISEGLKWVAGDFEDPLDPSNLANTEGFCLRSGCHTQGAWHDRHDSMPLENVEGCASCHVMHLNHAAWPEA